MTADERRVAELVREAFESVTLGDGVGLLQGQGLDDYAGAETLAEYRSRDEKDDWSRIPVSELNDCHSSLAFFDAQGMRFHLPAYLMAELEGSLTQDVLFYLTYVHDENAILRFAVLNDAQRSAVREFLFLRLSDPQYEYHRPLIEMALEKYWMADT